MTARTVMAVANPNAEYVGRPARRRPSSETSTVVPASTTERPAVTAARSDASTTGRPAARPSRVRVSSSNA